MIKYQPSLKFQNINVQISKIWILNFWCLSIRTSFVICFLLFGASNIAVNSLTDE